MENLIDRIINFFSPTIRTDDIAWLNSLTLQLRSYLQPKLPCTFDANEVFENIYLGSYSAALCHDELIDHGITHILSVADLKPGYPNEFIYKVIPYRDSGTENIFAHLDEAHRFIKEATNKGKVLIHCVYGISRSSSVLITYLIKEYGYSYREALEYIRENRPKVNPNDNFVEQLLEYEKYGGTIDQRWIIL